MTRRRERKPFNPHFWTQVRARLYCALGAHDVGPGTWVRERRGDPLRMKSCAACLESQYKIVRPVRPFSMAADAPADVRSRQVGDE
jgi:hypothetical protein